MILRKRSLATALVLAVAASGAIVAPSFAASAATTTITIWNGAESAEKDQQTPIIAKWAKTQGLTVNVVYKKDVRDAFITAVPEGKGPDLMVGAHDWTGQLVSSGTIAPIAVGALVQKFSKDMKNGFNVSGKLYGLPIYTENIALVYNKSIAKDPKGMTWEQLLDSSRGVTLPWQRGGTGNDPYHFSPIATSFGISVFERDKNGWTKTVGYKGAGADAYAAWLAKNGKKFVDGGWDQMRCNIQNGGYAITGPWIIGGLGDKTSTKLVMGDGSKKDCEGKAMTEDEIGITNFPSAGGKTPHQFSGQYGYWQSVKVAGSKNSTNVGKVLRYIGSADFQSQFANISGAERIPANIDALAKMNNKNLAAFSAAGKNAWPMPAYPFMDSVWSKVGAAEKALLEGTATGGTAGYFDKAMAALQTTVNSL
jgi:arabinogalactan oligomer/maltooligosaccharide transport system substrate-binding protein